MPINPRAVAIEGFGFGTRYVAKLGFETEVEIVVRPIATGGVGSVGPALKPDYEIIITVRRKGKSWVRRYLVKKYSYTRIFAKLVHVLVHKWYVTAKHRTTINNRIKVIAEVKHEHFKD
jgi:hypothetical protein